MEGAGEEEVIDAKKNLLLWLEKDLDRRGIVGKEEGVVGAGAEYGLNKNVTLQREGAEEEHC